MVDTRPARALYLLHPAALTVLHGDVESHALGQTEAFVGTAGSVVLRSNASGFSFYAHQTYDALGKKRERYLAGPKGSPQADARADALRGRIAEQKALVPSLRLLGREGFQLVDARTYATVAALHNAGVFAAGGMLVGSHAYGVILNRLGLRAAGYATEDIDLARAKALEGMPKESLLASLNGSGVEFVEVPHLDRKKPPTSWKQRGRSSFHVDLLAPSRDGTYGVVAVPELAAHATTLPFLGYLLAESQTGALLAREGCCAVRVPLPERFAVHKLIVSRLRVGRDAKADKDLAQARVLCAALGDSHPGALATAIAALPKAARRHLRAALDVLEASLAPLHPRAWDELTTR